MSSAEKDLAAVRALYQQLMDGWNEGSGESFAAPFAEDGVLIGFAGTHLKGRGEIVSFHQPLFDRWLKGTRLVGEVTSVRFLAPSVALMHAMSRKMGNNTSCLANLLPREEEPIFNSDAAHPLLN